MMPNNDGLSPYERAGCHGTNGAPDGHSSGTCSSCHGSKPHRCTTGEFPIPDSCVVCHPS